ncbi:MAG: helix-turn-helix transcriptional regulator [Chloroflexota bacterium]
MISTPGPALASLPDTRREILRYLKRSGEADAVSTARALGITPSAVRQHFTSLERDGLVTHRSERRGPGRPQHAFRLTPGGDALFPRNYDELANELLSYVEDENPELLERIFSRRGRRRLERTNARTAGLDFDARVAELTRILDEDGYLAEFERRPDGSYLVTENNCAILGVAFRYGHACSSELEYLQAALPDATVTRVAHRLATGHVCAYHIRRNP